MSRVQWGPCLFLQSTLHGLGTQKVGICPPFLIFPDILKLVWGLQCVPSVCRIRECKRLHPGLSNLLNSIVLCISCPVMGELRLVSEAGSICKRGAGLERPGRRSDQWGLGCRAWCSIVLGLN